MAALVVLNQPKQTDCFGQLWPAKRISGFAQHRCPKARAGIDPFRSLLDATPNAAGGRKPAVDDVDDSGQDAPEAVNRAPRTGCLMILQQGAL